MKQLQCFKNAGQNVRKLFFIRILCRVVAVKIEALSPSLSYKVMSYFCGFFNPVTEIWHLPSIAEKSLATESLCVIKVVIHK